MITDNKRVLDKEWLGRVYFAYYNVYNKENSSKDIEDFITWLYKQYGIVQEEKAHG
jgi:hypothetical protein